MPQIAHLQQCSGHLGQPFRLLPQKREELRRFRLHIKVLCGKQLQLRLHQRQRRAQLVGGIAGELPLGGKGVVQPLQHLIEGAAELPELRKHIFVDPHIRQIVQLHLLHLRSKAAQGLESASADEVSKNAAQDRHRRRDIPVGGAEASLRPIDDDGQLLVGRYELWVKARCFALIQDHRAAALQGVRNFVHIVHAGGAEQQIHSHAGNADEQNSHQRDAPLQGNLFHASSPPIR